MAKKRNKSFQNNPNNRGIKAELAMSPVDKLTLAEARKIMAEKDQILEEQARLQRENEEAQGELEKKQAILRSNHACEELLQQRDAILHDAEVERETILEQGRNAALQMHQNAIAKVNEEAEAIIVKAKSQGDVLLETALAEQAEIVAQKCQVAEYKAACIVRCAVETVDQLKDKTEADAVQREQLMRQQMEQERLELLQQTRRQCDAIKKEQDAQWSQMEEHQALAQQEQKTLLAEAHQKLTNRKLEIREEEDRLVAKMSELELLKRQQEKQAIYLNAKECKLKQMVIQQVADEIPQVKAAYEDLRLQLRQRKKEIDELTKIKNDIQGKCDVLQRGEAAQLLERNQTLEQQSEKTQKEKEALLGQVKGLEEEKSRIQGQMQDLSEEVADLKRERLQSHCGDEALAAAQQRVLRLQEEKLELQDALDSRKEISRDHMIGPILQMPETCNRMLAQAPSVELEELDWLAHIKTQAEKSGIYFSQRQLQAYHTAMKIGEWSPLTVLSGISGTGKSELPRQYAVHGGMHFLSIPVKPDWDSPSSLFGYYNALENKFEATELVRILYQMQENQTFSGQMLMILLDEINLAHPELYFSELLSKFESARGSKQLPFYELTLGAGALPEPLTIGRNVLWTGTMNEDETTKGLSDKVVDRSTLITFPRPNSLHSRTKCTMEPPVHVLQVGQWEAWKQDAIPVDAEALTGAMDAMKQDVESMNRILGQMGRNLGHRVWQGIQNYICNHPEVIDAHKRKEGLELALSNAYAEAVAFKVMPKLRGLEIRGTNRKSLDAMGQIIANHIQRLEGDFQNAMSMTTEVFQWNSGDFML